LPSCITSILVGVFAMGTKLSSPCPVPPANWPDDPRTRLQPPYLSGPASYRRRDLRVGFDAVASSTQAGA
jgi:hypothetical protein